MPSTIRVVISVQWLIAEPANSSASVESCSALLISSITLEDLDSETQQPGFCPDLTRAGIMLVVSTEEVKDLTPTKV